MRSRRSDPAGLEKYLREQVRILGKGKKVEWSVDAVHKNRVAARRVKAALDVVKPLAKRSVFKALNKRARRIRESLGEIREIDVQLQQLSRLGRHAASARSLCEQLSARRAKLESSFADTSTHWFELKTGDAVNRELEQLRPAIHALVREGVLSDFEDFCEQAEKAISLKEGVELHALRIAAKRFRYQLEIADAVGFPAAAKAAERFERMQDALGEWHDEAVLAQSLARHSADSIFDEGSVVAQKVIDLCRQRLERANTALHAFRSEWRTSCEPLIGLVRELADAPVTKSKAGRGRPTKR